MLCKEVVRCLHARDLGEVIPDRVLTKFGHPERVFIRHGYVADLTSVQPANPRGQWRVRTRGAIGGGMSTARRHGLEVANNHALLWMY